MVTASMDDNDEPYPTEPTERRRVQNRNAQRKYRSQHPPSNRTTPHPSPVITHHLHPALQSAKPWCGGGLALSHEELLDGPLQGRGHDSSRS